MSNNKLTGITLDQFLGTQVKNKIMLGESLIHFIAQDSVNKLAVAPLIGIPESLNEDLEMSRISEIRKVLEYRLSQGHDMAMVKFKLSTGDFYRPMRVSSYSEVANRLEYITLIEDEVFTDENKGDYSATIHFFIKDGNVYKVPGLFWFKNKTLELSTDENDLINYKTSIIPVHIFKNNARKKGDVEEVKRLIKSLSDYSNDFRTEWKKSSLQFGNNKMFGSMKTSQEWQKALEGGLDVHDFASPDGTLQLPLAQITGQVATIQQLLLQFNYLEDKALKYSFTMRETTSSGTNKHNLEVATFNQASYEYLMNKKSQREMDWKWFFHKALEGKTKLSEISIENPISELESLKIDNMRAQVVLIEAQAQQAAGTGQNQAAMAAQAITAPEGDINE